MSVRSSFRARIVILTTVACGLVLVLFGTVILSMHESRELAQLDRELVRLGRHHSVHLADHVHELEHEHGHTHGHEDGGYPGILHPVDSFLGEHLQDVHYAAIRSGAVLARSEGWPEVVSLAAVAVDQWRSAHPRMETVEGSPAFRVVRVHDHDHTIVVALDLTRHRQGLGQVRLHLWLSVAVGLLLVVACAWGIANRALRPISRLTALAEEVTADALDTRISDYGVDREFARLIECFNGMLERLERSFQQSTRFTANASHELKTPLTIMQGHVEVALGTTPDGSDAQRALAAQLDEIQRLKLLVNKLLVLSRADAGALRLDRRELDFSAAVASVCDDACILAPELTFEVSLEPEVIVDGDPNLLQQAAQNLVSNAAKYNSEDGHVSVSLSSDGDVATLRVANTGAEIPVEDASRMFDRFFRGSRSRNRSVDGLGLGLSLAREIARAHDGTLDYVGRTADHTVFELALPRARVRD